MRKKSETKQKQIVETASCLFLEQGFDGTSMSEIAAKVGGSKATLYSYFANKEQIFTEVMLQSAHKIGSKVFEVFDSKLPLCEKFRKFGAEYLNFITSQTMVDIRRAVMAEIHKIDIGKDIYERGIKKKWSRVVDILEAGMKAGEVRKADPWKAAMQLRSLLESEMLDLRMLGVKTKYTKAEIEAQVERAMDVFWTYYKK